MSAAVSLPINSCFVTCLWQAWIGKAPLRCMIFLTMRVHGILRSIRRMIHRQVMKVTGISQKAEDHQAAVQKEKQRKNKDKKEKKDVRSKNTANEPGSSSISEHFSLPEEPVAPVHLPADTSHSSSQLAPRPHRRSMACDKPLVRAGLRCRCHFIYVSRCPYTEFTPDPVD